MSKSFLVFGVLLLILVTAAVGIYGLYCLIGNPDDLWEIRRRSFERRGVVAQRPDDWDSQVRWQGIVMLIIAIGGAIYGIFQFSQ